jgi:hypothetical protein
MNAEFLASLAIVLGLGAGFSGLFAATRASGERSPLLQAVVGVALMLTVLGIVIAFGFSRLPGDDGTQTSEIAPQLAAIQASLVDLHSTSKRHEAHLVELMMRPVGSPPVTVIEASNAWFGWPALVFFLLFVVSMIVSYLLRRQGAPPVAQQASVAAMVTTGIMSLLQIGEAAGKLVAAWAGDGVEQHAPQVHDNRIFAAFGAAATPPALATFVVPFEDEGGCSRGRTKGMVPSDDQANYLKRLARDLIHCASSRKEPIEIEVRGFSSSSRVEDSWHLCGASSAEEANFVIANRRAEAITELLETPCPVGGACALHVRPVPWPNLAEMERGRRFNDTRLDNGIRKYSIERARLNRRVEVHLKNVRDCEFEIGGEGADVVYAPAPSCSAVLVLGSRAGPAKARASCTSAPAPPPARSNAIRRHGSSG